MHHRYWPGWIAFLLLAGCGGEARLRIEEGTGPDPTLPPPADEGYVPVVDIAPAVGWSEGERPTAAAGLRVNAFATHLDHPRWLYVLPNGDVLVAETNAPERPLRDDLLGIKGWVMGKVMARAGAAVPSANRITLLRDSDSDGQADVQRAGGPGGAVDLLGRLAGRAQPRAGPRHHLHLQPVAAHHATAGVDQHGFHRLACGHPRDQRAQRPEIHYPARVHCDT
jgi:hypothetical protein